MYDLVYGKLMRDPQFGTWSLRGAQVAAAHLYSFLKHNPIIRSNIHILWNSDEILYLEPEWKRTLTNIYPVTFIDVKHNPDYVHDFYSTLCITDKLIDYQVSYTRSIEKVAVVVHLYHYVFWEEIYTYIQNIPSNITYDIYVYIPDDPVDDNRQPAQLMVDTIDKLGKDNIFAEITPNKGRDIGSFLKFINDKKWEQYDAICKVHSKLTQNLGASWRTELLHGVLGQNKVDKCLKDLISLNITGSQKHLLPSNDKRAMTPGLKSLINHLCNIFDVTSNNTWHFYAGTMFWITSNILHHIQKRYKSQMTSTLGEFTWEILPEEPVQKCDTILHAWERCFGIIASAHSPTGIAIPPLEPIEGRDIHIVMCSWNRVGNLDTIIPAINKQTVADRIHFHILNNNNQYVNEIAEKIQQYNTGLNIQISLTHYNNENNCFQRFLYVKDVLIPQHNIEYVIFIDDDQSFDSSWVEKLYSKRGEKKFITWYGKTFSNDDKLCYWKPDVNHMHCTKSKLPHVKQFQYGGPGGSIVDASIFNADSRLWDIESIPIDTDVRLMDDIWLSYIVSTYDWTIDRSFLPPINIHDKDESIGLFPALREEKTTLFDYLVDKKHWLSTNDPKPSSVTLLPELTSILNIMTCYNEIEYIPKVIQYYKNLDIDIYVIDNKSTDGSWEWLNDNNIPCEQVDTDNCFNLKMLQSARLKAVSKAEDYDWIIYGDADEYIVCDHPLNEVLSSIDSKYNIILMKSFDICNTEEDRLHDITRTYFYYKERYLAQGGIERIHRNIPGIKYSADAIEVPNKNVYVIPTGNVLNYGNTKTEEQRVDVYNRRLKSWKLGYTPKTEGAHYTTGTQRGWKWDKNTLLDMRQHPDYKFIQPAIVNPSIDINI